MWSFLKKRFLQDGVTRSDIVELVPFDVTVGLAQDTGVDVFALTDIVEDWLGTAFGSNDLGQDFARFTTVILDYTHDKRSLQSNTLTTFVASYTGVTVWTRQGDLSVPDKTVVASIQTQAFIQDQGLLLTSLQGADDSTGLGSAVTNVRASINTSGGNNGDPPPGGLDVIIIVAIAIAGLAFLLLGFALFMAWRHAKQTAAKGQVLSSPEATGDESDFGENSGTGGRQSAAAKAATNPPSEVQASQSGLYPESVISEDISTSLTAYYQSGMGNKRMGSNMLNDAASVSSMESYGYSLDGYTNSIAPTDAKDDPY
jgi:hypothetical protein